MAEQTTEKRKMIIGTTNPGKFGEIMEVLGELPYEFLSPEALGIAGQAEETGNTHEENAFAKAKFYFDRTGILTLGEDSGIEVDALKGELGIRTRRWGAGEKADDDEWIAYFLEAMKDVPPHKRTARFVCVGAVCSEKCVKCFRGETAGVITADLEAPITEGIPLSSCFRPEGMDKVYAALTRTEKNLISHRGKAMRAVKSFLESRVAEY